MHEGHGRRAGIVVLGAAAAAAWPVTAAAFVNRTAQAPALDHAALAVALALLAGVAALALRRRLGSGAIALLLGAMALGGVVAVTAAPWQSGGTWRSHQQAAASPGQTWTITGELHEGALSGAVVVSGSGLIEHGTFAGTMVDGAITGTLFDAAGNAVATFAGTRDGSAIHGTYRASNGDVGELTWQPS